MRVKKYKRVKRPKVHVGLPGPGEDRHDGASNTPTGLPVPICRPEESDSNVEADNEHQKETAENGSIAKRENTNTPRRTSNVNSGSKPIEMAGPHVARTDSVTSVRDKGTEGSIPVASTDCVSTPATEQKGNNQSMSDTDVHAVEEVAVVATAITPPDAGDFGGSGGSGGPLDIYDSRTMRDDPALVTPATSEEVASPTTPSVNLDNITNDGRKSYCDGQGGAAASTLTAATELEKAQKRDNDDDAAAQDGGDDDIGTTSTCTDDHNHNMLSGGSVWFKAERVAIFVQLLALVLDVDGAGWPPLFLQTWGWTWFTTEYLRWPLLILVRRVGTALSLSLGSEGLGLWFFRDVVGYGVEMSAVLVAVFVLFFVLQMPDYTSQKPKEKWQRSFLTHWFRLTLPWYVFNLSLCYGVFAALAYYGSVVFPPDVITAVIVVGGTLITVSWLFVVLLSFLIHLYFRSATKHGAEFSFMIAMVRSSAYIAPRDICNL